MHLSACLRPCPAVQRNAQASTQPLLVTPHQWASQAQAFGVQVRNLALPTCRPPQHVLASIRGRQAHVRRCNEEHHQHDTKTTTADGSEHQGLGVSTALWLLAAYQGLISPLIPKSCRFVPTCSNYSRQAVVEFGVAKGTVLTAWRVLRCNPWGGTGYDPPAWPPVSLREPSG